ncbi:MAG TPA: hypothetical protein P5277_00155 [Candidatus Paceibacterota bacterium]|nr:hypothetical protein [Candidatus Paceibacterota bacterium]
MMANKLSKWFFEFVKENYLSCIVFVISTIAFLLQHYFILSWDFSAYVINARYLFYNGTYFETIRPPLVPALLGIFLVFGIIGEYFFILFVSVLFFISSFKLSSFLFENLDELKVMKKEHFNLLFYLLSTSAFTLLFGLANGSELLGLILFEFFIIALISGKNSGIFLGLAFLTRYNFLIFFPLLFFNKNYKKILINIFSFFIIIFPWFLFNYFKFHNWFAGFVDAYVNNISSRQTIFQSINFYDLLLPVGFLLPFFVLGLLYFFKRISIFNKNYFKNNKIYIIFFVLTIAFVYSYFTIPLRQPRYLFNLILPVTFFSIVGIAFLINKFNKLKIPIIIALIFIFLFSFFILIYEYKENAVYDDKFYLASEDILKLNISNCEILSPHWVLISYFTENVYPLGLNDINKSLESKKIVLIFYDDPTFDDLFDLNQLNYSKFYETKDYVFFSDDTFEPENCAKKYISDETYVLDHCLIISEKFSGLGVSNFSYRICKLINKK